MSNSADTVKSFGGFASKYIKGKFFMDVHPPLAKLLITLAGWLAGFNGEFDFKDIGKDYLEPGVPYVAMRLLPALMGVMTVPAMFLTLKATACRTRTAAMGAGLIIFGTIALPKYRTTADAGTREWPTYTITIDSTRLAADCLHCFYSIGLDMLHKSTRTRPVKGF